MGTHRANTRAELEWMLGRDIVNYRILQHNAWDKENLAYLGAPSQRHPQYVNRVYYEADIKIATGFIQPHICRQWKSKAILPGGRLRLLCQPQFHAQ